MLGGQLRGPDPGQGPPGRHGPQDLDRRQIIALLQNPAAQAHVVRLAHVQPPDGPAGLPLPADRGRGCQPAFPPGQRRDRAVPGKGARDGLRRFLREELHLQLLHGVKLLMALQIQLHVLPSRM